MKKIIVGIIGVVAVMAITAGTAFAVFTATATVNNVAFTTGTVGLQFSADGTNYRDNFNFPTFVRTDLYPGYTTPSGFYIWLKNTGTLPLNNIRARLTTASGDWGVLAPVSYMSINAINGPLTNWNSTSVSLNVATLAAGGTVQIPVVFSIDSGAGNEIAGKWVSTNWVITGTQ